MNVKKKIYGDFQTPRSLASEIALVVRDLFPNPSSIVEPSSGMGAFLLASSECFPGVPLVGFDISDDYCVAARSLVEGASVFRADLFHVAWGDVLSGLGSVLVLGNPPWVASSEMTQMGGFNRPRPDVALSGGVSAISGASNFDVSEWLLVTLIGSLPDAPSRSGMAMLVKTGTARKAISFALSRGSRVCTDARIYKIDGKRNFGVNVSCCLLYLDWNPEGDPCLGYTEFESLSDVSGREFVFRDGRFLGAGSVFGDEVSPVSWRSGVKHDASKVFEFSFRDGRFFNGFGESPDLEPDLLYPLMKGSDLSKGDPPSRRVLVTQRHPGDCTDWIRQSLPKTWSYLLSHGEVLDHRGSKVYLKKPRFSMFGVGDYAFKPWKIAIAGLYKSLNFRLVGPVEEMPVQFDDTVYYMSFDTEEDAREAFDLVRSESVLARYDALIFWDDMRPVKASVLNAVDWSA